MKILKQLSKIFLISIFFSFFSNSYSNEAVDIWNLNKEKEKEETISTETILSSDETTSSSISISETENNNINFTEENLEKDIISLVGLYDPEENDLKIDMWSTSDGDDIRKIFKKIQTLNLSEDSKNILQKVLLTNSYFPDQNINFEEFLEFQTEFLIKYTDLDLIKNYIIKNEKINIDSKLVNYYLDYFLSNSDLENACEIFNYLNNLEDNYSTKFKIYCLINSNNREQAQLIFDLKKEQGFKDDLFENRFNYLMEYEVESNKKISEKSILDFHLSHRTNTEFKYEPNEKTPKKIWKYLSSSNLLENIDLVDLEDIEKVKMIEKATHEENYTEVELFNLYKRFQFNFNQFLTAKDTYKSMPNSEGRALLYQRLLLTIDSEEKLDLSLKLKKSFVDDDIENAFSNELSKILNKIQIEDVPSNFTTFYNKNLIKDKAEKTKIKYNNKVIHQSKLIDYFSKNYSKEKTEKDLNDLLKKIKKNKKYIFSTKDIIMLDSLRSDGIQIKNIYDKLYVSNSDIPPDIQAKIQNDEIGMVLLRIVEIIGEDSLDSIGSETLNFIINILNQLDMDKLRNKILLQVLPLKV
tara:strand:- start:1544 stop:3289 length:1746 start_codon:yes stop_codon:yes gene_type:complete